MKRCPQCESLMPEDEVRCVRCGWLSADPASTTPQAQEQQQARAAKDASRTARLRKLAALLTSNMFLFASCTGGTLVTSTVTTLVQDEAQQTPIDEVSPGVRYIAVIAATGGAPAPGMNALTYTTVRLGEEDVGTQLAKFRSEHPGYGFVPATDKGHISGEEWYVDYEVLKREPAKAVVRTHYRIEFPGVDIRATYEATDSDVRVISYKAGADIWTGFFAGMVIMLVLGLTGEFLKWRYLPPTHRKSMRRPRLSPRMRLATVLASNGFFVASCTGGMAVASVALEPGEVAVDQANPPTVAVIGATADPSSPEKRLAEYLVVKDCDGALAKLRRENPSYSFLPPSEEGFVDDADPSVPYIEYRVLKRESGKALVKTHFIRKAPPFDSDTHATYEATDSDVRLLSYRSGSDLGRRFFVGLVLASLLAIFGRFLKRRFASAPDTLTERESPPDQRWKAWLRTGAGTLSVLGIVCVRTKFGVPLFALAGLVWVVLKWRESRRASAAEAQPAA